MRITTQTVNRQQMSYLSAVSAEKQRAAQQMVTGQRMLRWSDDPLAAQSVNALERGIARGNSYKKVMERLSGSQERSEAGLASLLQQLDVAVARLTGALNDEPNSGSPQTKARALGDVRDALLERVNAVDIEKRAIFAGTAGGSLAVRYDPNAAAGARYTYVGNDERQRVAISETESVDVGQSLPEVAALLNTLDVAISALEGQAGAAANDETRRALQAALDDTNRTQEALEEKRAQGGYLGALLDSAHERTQNLGLAWQDEAMRQGAIDRVMLPTQLADLEAVEEIIQKLSVTLWSTSLFDYF